MEHILRMGGMEESDAWREWGVSGWGECLGAGGALIWRVLRVKRAELGGFSSGWERGVRKL